MPNDNCLENIRCPGCDQEDRFLITASILADVTDGGADIARGSDMEWDDDSIAACPECGRNGPLRTFRELPPDPDEMNDERALWAETALASFRDATGADKGDALSNLLCDLMHWCDRNRQSFLVAMERAQMHYDAETLGDSRRENEEV